MLVTPDMKKKTIEPKLLTESECEELIRLRAEIDARKMRCATQGEKVAIIKDLREYESF